MPLYKSIYANSQPMLPSVSNHGTVISPNHIDAIVCKWLCRLLKEELEIKEVLQNTQRELEELLQGK